MTTEHEDAATAAAPSIAQAEALTAPPPFPEQPSPPPSRTNVLAIVALVSSFFVGLAGVICGIISLVQIKRTGGGGRGLAIAGIVVGGLQLVTGIVVSLLLASAIAVGAAMSSASHSVTVPDFSRDAGSSPACAGLKATVTEWSDGLDPTSLALDPAAGMRKLGQLRDELRLAEDTIADPHLSAAVESAVTALDDLIATAEPYDRSPETLTSEAAADISTKLQATLRSLRELQTMCGAG